MGEGKAGGDDWHYEAALQGHGGEQPRAAPSPPRAQRPLQEEQGREAADPTEQKGTGSLSDAPTHFWASSLPALGILSQVYFYGKATFFPFFF